MCQQPRVKKDDVSTSSSMLATVTEPTWLSEDELRAWRDLSLMQFQLSARLGRELAADGLSYQDYLILAALTDGDGRLRANELGLGLGWEKSRLSHHITRMVERGLVTREKCPTDQRGSFVVITDKGRRANRAAAPAHVAAVRRFFVDLVTPSQLATIAEVAETVLAKLAAECDQRAD